MDTSAVIVAAIGLLGVIGGQIVSRMGHRADVQQKKVAEAAVREHQQFEELRSLLAEYRTDADRLRDDLERERMVSRQLRADLVDLARVVRSEVAREAAKDDGEGIAGL